MIRPQIVNIPAGCYPEFPLDLVMFGEKSRGFIVTTDGTIEEQICGDCILVPTFHMKDPEALKKKLILHVVNLGLEVSHFDCFVNPVMFDGKQGFAVLNARPA
jgi:hypothetical protein